MPPGAYPRPGVAWADSKYHNHALNRWLKTSGHRFRIDVVRRPRGTKGFVPLRRRWVVERTFAWLGRSRRLSKDRKRLAATSEAMVQAAAVRHMLRYLGPAKPAKPFRYKRPPKKTVSP